MSIGWNDEREARASKLAADGLSASKIADKLGGGVTRCGVIGKLNRLKGRGGITTLNARHLRSTHPNSPWTAAKIAEFHELYADGLGDGAIAAGMGEPFTRKMVQGKRKNLGLPSHFASPATRKAMRAPYRTPSPAIPPGARVNGSGKHASDCRPAQGLHIRRRSEEVGTAAAVERSAAALKPAIDFFDAPARPLTIHELRDEHCKWPLGDPSDLDTFRYCGARVDLPGIVPYCGCHCRMAYARAA